MVEGPTDRIVLTEILPVIWGDRPFVLTELQPEYSESTRSFGRTGTGWKGVRSWCRQTVEELGDAAVIFELTHDLIVIHLDADVAHEVDLTGEEDLTQPEPLLTTDGDLVRPCPPAADTFSRLQDFVTKYWLQSTSKAEKFVFMTPSKSTETWIILALNAETGASVQCNECKPLKPEALLASNPHRFLERKDGKVKKNQETYQTNLAPVLARHWSLVENQLSSAADFASNAKRAADTAAPR